VISPDDDTGKAAWLLDQVRLGGCGCWITNTVQEAQRIFRRLLDLTSERELPIDLLLAHARCPVEDRQSIEQALMQRYGPEGQRPSRGIVIGTQVLEQSLDLDFDVMVTDLAPVDLLLQRAGRLHRHERPGRPPLHSEPVLWIYAPLDENGLPRPRHARIYAPYLQARTWQALAQRTSLHLPADYRTLLEEVYTEVAPGAADDLYPLWQRITEQRQKHIDEARLRIVKLPDPEEAFSIGREIQFREDEESSAWIVAQTRLGEESITLVPLEKVGDSTARLFPHNEYLALDQSADRTMQYRLLQRSFRVSHFAVVNALQSRDDRPALFRDSPLLRTAFPLWLDDGRTELTWNEQTYILTLDTRLGLVIEPKEKALDGSTRIAFADF
jgi:CRISPR-associated endonuclease/helicase Cas3